MPISGENRAILQGTLPFQNFARLKKNRVFNRGMSLRILIVPDKFKGTLTAQAAVDAIAAGWASRRPKDKLDLLPMSDGGDGFGEVMGALLGASCRKIRTMDAAHQACEAKWWFNRAQRIAIIESANVIGLAMLPHGKFHPTDLDTFGLGRVLLAAHKQGSRKCFIGIGGSATNDGGFGMARALGFRFLDKSQLELFSWTQLGELHHIEFPDLKHLDSMEIIVAMDVANPLLGTKGCSAIYGPQKGLRTNEIAIADQVLKRLARVVAKQQGGKYHLTPGAGAAGGLGFGLMAFLGAKSALGFELFARHAKLQKRVKNAHFVITGEGSVDGSSLMGKGVGETARLARKLKVPVIGLGGRVARSGELKGYFHRVIGLTQVTSEKEAKKNPAKWLKRTAALAADEVRNKE
ncbi:MAG: Glycerate kinase [Verrucomicrobiales bacterium]|nr:Glycerate kinase [Verrucomicrobiales bacterium]